MLQIDENESDAHYVHQICAADDAESATNDVDESALTNAKRFAVQDELPIEERALLMWVKVIYSGKIYLGKIQNMHENQCLVRCLDKPFGVMEGEFQDLEPEDSAVWYHTVYRSDVQPVLIQEQSQDGKTKRRGRFRYIYGKEW